MKLRSKSKRRWKDEVSWAESSRSCEQLRSLTSQTPTIDPVMEDEKEMKAEKKLFIAQTETEVWNWSLFRCLTIIHINFYFWFMFRPLISMRSEARAWLDNVAATTSSLQASAGFIVLTASFFSPFRFMTHIVRATYVFKWEVRDMQLGGWGCGVLVRIMLAGEFPCYW